VEAPLDDGPKAIDCRRLGESFELTMAVMKVVEVVACKESPVDLAQHKQTR